MKIAQDPYPLKRLSAKKRTATSATSLRIESPVPPDAASYSVLREQLAEVLHITPREELVLKRRFDLMTVKRGHLRRLAKSLTSHASVSARLRQKRCASFVIRRSKRLRDFFD